jgi:hypothetical protein
MTSYKSRRRGLPLFLGVYPENGEIEGWVLLGGYYAPQLINLHHHQVPYIAPYVI